LRFTYELATALGLPREEMLRRMTSRELTGWQAFMRVRRREHDHLTDTTRY